MSRFLSDLFEAVRTTFCKLARIQFEAPWQARRPDAC